MPHNTPCPSAQDLERFVLGQIPDLEAERIERHLTHCERCVEKLHTLKAEDALAKAVHAQTRAPEFTRSKEAESLVEHLCRLPAPGSDRREATAALDAASANSVKELCDSLAAPKSADELGRLGPYRVLKVLGVGGMGVVFEAEDTQLQRFVALKVMKPALATSESARRRFLREAQAIAGLSHDHIVSIYQVGEEHGIPFAAMQLLEGENLADRLRRQVQAGEHVALPLPEILRIGREIADGLAAAHAYGLVHRDIKPANIWLETSPGRQSRETRVKILDFGLARAVHEETRLTQLGTVVGTPAYMAPEQIEGRTVDARSDLFSLGCVLYEMCTGQMPYPGDATMGILLAVAKNTPKPIRDLNPEVPKALVDLVSGLLAKDPDQRPQSAHAVLEALTAIDLTARIAPWWRRRQLVPAMAVGLLILAAGVVVYLVIKDRIRKGHVPANAGAALPAPFMEDASSLQPALPMGAPLSPLALVSRPASIPGVRSWTVETRGHRGAIQAMVFSPDGRWLASAGDDGTIRLMHAMKGDLLRALVGHAGSVSALAWAPDSKTLASASVDGTVRLWNVDSGQTQRILKGHTWSVTAVCWSPDGRMLASGSRDKTVRLWEAASGRLLHAFQGHTVGVRAVAWSPKGKMLASAAEDNTVRLWDTDSRKSGIVFKEHASSVNAVAWSPDGNLLASGGAGRVVLLWEPGSGKVRHTLKGHRLYVQALAWAPDGKTLASGSADATVRLWDPDRDTSLLTHPCVDVIDALTWAADGKTLACGGRNATVFVWETATDQPVWDLPGHAAGHSALAWSPDGGILASGSGDATVRLWENRSGKLLASLTGHKARVRALAWSPDGTTLAAGSGKGDGAVLLWDAAGGKVLRRLEGITHNVSALAWSPSDRILACAGWDNLVKLWNPDSGAALPSLAGHGKPITSLAWSSDGGTLASGGDDGMIRLWGMPGGILLRPLKTTSKSVPSLAWSPDGTTLAAGSEDGVVRLWDKTSGKLLHSLKWRQPSLVRSVGWSADGKTLASCSEDRAVRLWDPRSGKLIRTIEGPGPGILSADLQRAAGLDMNTVRIWDVEDGRLAAALVALRDDQGLAVSHDGQTRGTPSVERELLYVVDTEQGQETLLSEQFAKKYGWQNDSEKR